MCKCEGVRECERCASVSVSVQVSGDSVRVCKDECTCVSVRV